MCTPLGHAPGGVSFYPGPDPAADQNGRYKPPQRLQGQKNRPIRGGFIVLFRCKAVGGPLRRFLSG